MKSVPNNGQGEGTVPGVAVASRVPVRCFTGRSREQKELEQALQRECVIEIVGSAGIGKTSLVQFVLQRQEGIKWCRLADAAGISEALSAVASTLGLEETGGGDEELATRIADVLAARPSLVVLDGAERVIEKLPPYLQYLCETTPSRFIITTRRALLGMSVRRIGLGPLSQEDSTEMLLSLAAADGATDLGPMDVQDLARKLEGLPLALSLVAPKLVLHSAADIADQLDAEEPILQRVLLRSWHLLEERDRNTLGACSLFDDGLSLAAALAVAGDEQVAGLEESLKSLIRDSWLTAERRPELAGEPRFHLTRAIREFVAGRLVVDANLYLRHALFFADLGERCVAAIESTDEAAATARLRLELPNLRIALQRTDWEQHRLLWVRLALVVHLAEQRRGELTGQAALTQSAVERAATLPPEWSARACLARARVARWQHQPEVAQALLTRGLEHARLTADPVLCAAILRNTASVALQQHDLTKAAAALDLAIAEAERGHRPVDEVNARNGMAYLHMQQEDFAEAERQLRLAESIASRTGVPGLRALVASALAELMMMTARAQEGIHQLTLAIESYSTLHYSRQLATAFIERARARCFATLPGVEDDLNEAQELANGLGLRALHGEVQFARGLAAIARNDSQSALAQLQDALPWLPVSRGRTAMLYCALVHALAGEGAAATPWLRAAGEEPRSPVEPRRLTTADDVIAALARGQEVGENTPTPNSLEVRWLLGLGRTTEAAVCGRATADEQHLRVSQDERRFVLSHSSSLDLTRRRALRGILLCLCRRHLQSPGTPVSVPDLLEAGWPGERMLFDSGARRLYVTINRLRKLGLGNLVLTVGDGYMLAPHVTVVREGR